jgi:hypothetical protein
MPLETTLRPSPADERLLRLRLRRLPQVISRELGDCLMLIDVHTGFTYEASWLSAQVWRLLTEGHSVDEACAVLVQIHRHPRETIETEAAAFVRDLLGYGLVSEASPSTRA